MSRPPKNSKKEVHGTHTQNTKNQSYQDLQTTPEKVMDYMGYTIKNTI